MTAGLSGRDLLLERLAGRRHDVLVVGGGVNGAVSALALAAHGLRVALVEADDFASGVSQESSNLIWGGFKYLQTFEVGLVAGLCRSRNRLARAYASRVMEARFVAALGPTSPYSTAYASLGAHAYWALGRFATQRPRRVTARTLSASEPAVEQSGIRGAVEYSDYLLADSDARFVLQFVLDAADRGAVAVSRVRLDGAESGRCGWRAEVTDRLTGDRHRVAARMLVNAAGPRAAEVAGLSGVALDRTLLFSKGAHIVVPRVTESGRVLAFFDDDQRLFYVIPMGHRSAIGTTDTRVDEADASMSDADRDFLLSHANERLRLARPLGPGDVIAERCGVRVLVADARSDARAAGTSAAARQDAAAADAEAHAQRSWLELSRRHAVEVNPSSRAASILGGKLSDCLNVGEKVLAAARACGLDPAAGRGRWFGEPPQAVRAGVWEAAARAGLDEPAAATLWRRHGRRAMEVVKLMAQSPDLGAPLSDLVDYSEAEVTVMGRHEHIATMEDFLRRRTMLALLEPAAALASDPGVEKARAILFGHPHPAGVEAAAPGCSRP